MSYLLISFSISSMLRPLVSGIPKIENRAPIKAHAEKKKKQYCGPTMSEMIGKNLTAKKQSVWIKTIQYVEAIRVISKSQQ